MVVSPILSLTETPKIFGESIPLCREIYYNKTEYAIMRRSGRNDIISLLPLVCNPESL
jgi:hypothetical protein